MPDDLVAGVDCSTQSVKVVLVDPTDGRTVAEAAVGHATHGTDGASETHPAAWWQGLAEALARTGRASEVRAISVAAQQHGLVAVDGSGEPLRPAILWNDTRAAAAADRLLSDLGGPDAWAESVGSVPVASFTVASWVWLRQHEPEVAEAARGIRLPHDWLTERLCGEAVTDRGDASGTGWWSVRDERYAQHVLELPSVALREERLPDVLGPADVAGQVTPQAAEGLGLPRDAVVAVGTGDNMAAALGLGLETGTPALSLGTSGTAFVVTEQRAVDPSGVVAGFADASGRYLPLACTLNCTVAIERTAGWLTLARDDVAAATDVTMLPYLEGERTPNWPHASGMVTGLRSATTPQQILRGAYEGAVFSLLEGLEAIEKVTVALEPHEPIVLIGGGARGAAWQDVVKRLSGRPLRIPTARELVALGAATQAAGALLQEHPREVRRRWTVTAAEEQDAVARDDEALSRLRKVSEHARPLLAEDRSTNG